MVGKAQIQLQARIGLHEPGHQRHQQTLTCGGAGVDAHPALGLAMGGDRAFQRQPVGQQLPALLQHLLALGGEFQPAGGAAQQLHVQPCLQPGNDFTDRRGRDLEVPRRRREAAALGHLNEGVEFGKTVDIKLESVAGIGHEGSG